MKEIKKEVKKGRKEKKQRNKEREREKEKIKKERKKRKQRRKKQRKRERKERKKRKERRKKQTKKERKKKVKKGRKEKKEETKKERENKEVKKGRKKTKKKETKKEKEKSKEVTKGRKESRMKETKKERKKKVKKKFACKEKIGEVLCMECDIVWGAETWTLRRSEEKRIEAFEMWIWRRMECVKWTDRIKNEALFVRVVVITEEVQNVHLLLEYRPHIDVSLTCEHDPKLQENCVCLQNMPQFDCEGIPNQAPETNKPMILNGPTSRNREGSDQVSVKAKQLGHLYLSIDQETFDPSIECNLRLGMNCQSALLMPPFTATTCGKKNVPVNFNVVKAITQNGTIKIGDLSFEEVEKFKYLGATVTNINDTREEIKRRINMGNACDYSVEKLLSSSLLSKNLKVRIYKTVILPVVLYGCETWTLTLREEQRLRVFENKVLRKIFEAKRDEVRGEWRKLDNAELHALYSSPDIIRNIKCRRLRWAGHVARMGESRNAYRVLVGRPEGKSSLGRPRRRWEDNIKMDLREVGYDGTEWINLAQDRDQWRVYVRAAMNLRVT
ncbi:hypothetical protein ANN_09214 [Periplaneta americana]|uniref:Uncharacterized protein n=1 Tax=Periplaneta americana TaxID=6978 RepID=A0ABQ8TN91_PERAM|nr:hypothetical protein ANN_09214 [Periplaneta americana]